MICKHYNTVHLKIQKDENTWAIIQGIALSIIFILATGFVAYITTIK